MSARRLGEMWIRSACLGALLGVALPPVSAAPAPRAPGAVVAVVDRRETGWLVLVTEQGDTLDVPCEAACAAGEAARGERLREGSWVLYWPEEGLVEPLRAEGARRLTARLQRRVALLPRLD